MISHFNVILEQTEIRWSHINNDQYLIKLQVFGFIFYIRSKFKENYSCSRKSSFNFVWAARYNFINELI